MGIQCFTVVTLIRAVRAGKKHTSEIYIKISGETGDKKRG